MRNLIKIDDLSAKDVRAIHLKAKKYFSNPKFRGNLKGKLLVNFFFEHSTRTRLSFEIAAKRMGMEVVNVDIALSSLKKGELIEDMTRTIDAMRPSVVAVRHNSSGIMEILRDCLNVPLINAGDGTNEHPSQALLDSFVIWRRKGDFAGLKVVICGDVLHSRVARSNLRLLTKLGAMVRVVTPATLIPEGFKGWLEDNFSAELYTDFDEALVGADVVMMLRIQQERMVGAFIPSLEEYFKGYGLTRGRLSLAKDDVMVMHPGPVNRGVEIDSDLVDDEEFSVVLQQVEAGVAVRQAVLEWFC